MDKNKAVIDFLVNCPQISQNPIFFNFINATDNDKQLVTVTNDKAINKNYVDGSVLKRYTLTIIDFKSIAYRAIPKVTDLTDENVEEFMDVQAIVDWITEQAELHNYPDFGEDCVIEDMRTTAENPNLNGVDTSVTPALAKYSVSIQIDYLDLSKTIWKGAQYGSNTI